MEDRYLEACDLIDQGKLEEAHEQFLNMLQQNEKNHLVLNKLGVIYARWKKSEEARDYLKAAVEVSPDYAPAIVNLGNLLLEEKDYKGAITYYMNALEKDSEYYLAYYNLAVAYKKQGKLDDYFKNIKLYKRYYNQHINGQNREEAARLKNKALGISGIAVVLLVLFLILK